MELRRITPEDAEAAHQVTMAGFRTYHAFAPPGWEPPADMGAEGSTKRLARDGAFGVVAIDDDEVVGFAAYEPARQKAHEGFSGPLIPGLAHVWAVFVAESHWGQGVATRLLAAVTHHIQAADFGEARLYVAAGQTRARAFYAREGWREATAPFLVEELGLDLIEMRRSFQPRRATGARLPGGRRA
jgi:GNAT superfamily N-acetyltransferase